MTDLSRLHSEHVARLEREVGAVLERCGYDGLVVHSGAPLRQRSVDDQFWPLRPTPAFAHWLPLVVAGSALVVRPGARPLLLWARADSFWEGAPPVEGDHFWGPFEVREVAPERLAGELPPGRLAFVGDASSDAAAWGLDDELRNPPALVAELDALRALKSDYERACIAEASARARRGHEAVREAFAASDLSELELHLAYLGATGQDAMDTPYQNIVALGEHAAILHHVVYDRRRPDRAERSLLIDAGATRFGYASDVTRTYVRGDGAAAQTFRALVERIEALELALVDAVRPGIPYESLHDRAHQELAPILRELGLARASDDELVGAGVTRAFFPHGLGHSLGLQVHDVGCRLVPPSEQNPFLRNTTEITAGQVFTIEPGCYVIPGLLEPLRAEKVGAALDWDAIDALRPFGGVRIEDDVAVTDSGAENLSRA